MNEKKSQEKGEPEQEKAVQLTKKLEGEAAEKKTQLTFEELKKKEAGEVLVIENPDFEIKTFLDIEAMRVEKLKLPVGYGKEEKPPKKNLHTVNGVSLSVLEQKLYNFKLLCEEGSGRRKIYLKPCLVK